MPLRLMEKVKCRNCGRTQLKLEVNALRPDKLIEIKCYACNAFNQILGRDIIEEIPTDDEMIRDMHEALTEYVENSVKVG